MPTQPTLMSFFSRRPAPTPVDSSPPPPPATTSSGDSSPPADGTGGEAEVSTQCGVGTSSAPNADPDPTSSVPARPGRNAAPVYKLAAGVELVIDFVPPPDISTGIDGSPVQPVLRSFPKSVFGAQNRAFSPSWYTRHPMIEYSIIEDKIYCFYCRHLTTTITNNMPWVTGYSDWKHLSDHIELHFLSKAHEICHQGYTGYLETKIKGAVNTRLPGTGRSDVLRNRSVITAHAQVVLLCAKQDLPLRGHREDDEEKNSGNFLEVLRLLKSREPELLKASAEMPSNAKYVSFKIQNELLDISGALVRKMIATEVKEDLCCFSIIADETRDAGGTEQLCLCLRYLCQHKIKERFIAFIDLHSFDSEAITSAILEILGKAGLDIRNCVAQSYDGASVMSGKKSGANIRIQSKIGEACPYIHCYAHRLNLVLVECCNSISRISELLGLLQAIYNFQSNSAVRKEYFENAQKNLLYLETLKLPKSVDTRWTTQKRGIEYFRKRYDAVINALEDIVENGKKEEAAECRGYLSQLLNFGNICTLILMDEVLSITNPLSEYLQSADLSYTRALTFCQSTISQLREFRSPESFQNIWVKAALLAENVSVDVPDQSAKNSQVSKKRKRSASTRLKDSVVLSTTGSREADQSDQTVGQTFLLSYYEVIDKFISELSRRLCDHGDLLNGITASDPSQQSFLNPEIVLTFCKSFSRFNFNVDSMTSQIRVARDLLRAEMLTSTESCLEYVSKMKDSFPDLYVYFSLVLCIPISNATGERSFSSLNRIKTHLRTTMEEDRLSNLAVISIERDLSNKLRDEPSIVVDEFAKCPSRRIPFVL